jgi:hypothetical protein
MSVAINLGQFAVLCGALLRRLSPVPRCATPAPRNCSGAQADEIAKDCGLSPEDVLGRPVWRQDTPFFLQNRFGRD